MRFNGKTVNTPADTIRFLPKGENKEYVVNVKEHGECIDVFFDTDFPISDEIFTIEAQNNKKIESLFKKLFVKKFGVPPAKYVIQLKTNYACDLLQSGRYTATKVSEMCRYSDLYYFSHQFKEYTGVSPSEYKKVNS